MSRTLHRRLPLVESDVEALLDAVPGLGPTRRAALLKHFGSVRKLRAADVQQIAAVPGFGPRTAAAVLAALGGRVPAAQEAATAATSATEASEVTEVTEVTEHGIPAR